MSTANGNRSPRIGRSIKRRRRRMSCNRCFRHKVGNNTSMWDESIVFASGHTIYGQGDANYSCGRAKRGEEGRGEGRTGPGQVIYHPKSCTVGFMLSCNFFVLGNMSQPMTREGHQGQLATV